tara:strand:- start:521 stop:700 length:180 start_codon:yes stop_codon:yes gene_type:complete
MLVCFWQRFHMLAAPLHPPSKEGDEEWIEALANEYADRLSKEFGTKLANNTTIAAPRVV